MEILRLHSTAIQSAPINGAGVIRRSGDRYPTLCDRARAVALSLSASFRQRMGRVTGFAMADCVYRLRSLGQGGRDRLTAAAYVAEQAEVKWINGWSRRRPSKASSAKSPAPAPARAWRDMRGEIVAADWSGRVQDPIHRFTVIGNRRFGVNLLAIASATCSLVSNAIFCASTTSPGASGASVTKQ